MEKDDFFLRHAERAVRSAQDALGLTLARLDQSFCQICQIIASTQGHVIVMAVGKSAWVAKKFASTLASLGQPAFFVHPCDAGHGDCGNITEKDVVVMFSNSGGTSELLKIVPTVRRRAKSVLGVFGAEDALLSEVMDVTLVLGVTKESCALGLAPTTSVTVFGVICDAIAAAVAAKKGFTENDFAMTHPYGSLGRNLTMAVADVMVPLDRCPQVFVNQSIVDSMLAMSDKALSVAMVYDESGQYLGMQSMALLRQALLSHANPRTIINRDYILANAVSLQADMLLHDAWKYLDDKVADIVTVMSSSSQPVGLWLVRA